MRFGALKAFWLGIDCAKLGNFSLLVKIYDCFKGLKCAQFSALLLASKSDD